MVTSPMAKKKTQQICIMTVTGADQVGIIAKLSAGMARANINIVDVNQKIMEDYFVMTMAVDVSKSKVDLKELRKRLGKIGSQMSLNITFQDEKIFTVMHRI